MFGRPGYHTVTTHPCIRSPQTTEPAQNSHQWEEPQNPLGTTQKHRLEAWTLLSSGGWDLVRLLVTKRECFFQVTEELPGETTWELKSRDKDLTRRKPRAEAFEEVETANARILGWDKSYGKASEAGA